MFRMIGSVLAGAALWAVFWCIGNATAMSAFPGAFGVDGSTDHVGILTSFILFSVLLSLAAGYVASRLGGAGPVRALAILQLSIGLFVEISYWGTLPVWYHLVFLALIVPATIAGGRAQRGSIRTTDASQGNVAHTRPA